MIHRELVVLGLLGALAARTALPSDTRILYEKESPYNTIMVTENGQGLRTLWFERGGSRQSVVKVGDPDHIELPYVRSMFVVLTFVEQPKRVLVVGLGGGTMPSFLHKHYPHARIDIVDIDPDVVDVARKFFGFREDALMRAHVKDGRRFIEECRDPYDIIFLDAFGSDDVPPHLTTLEFLRAARRAVTPDGIVVSNLWGPHINPLYDSMVRTYREAFNAVHILCVPGAGNRVLFAWPRRKQIHWQDWDERAAETSKTKGLRFDMGKLVRYGIRHAVETNSLGRVLRDKPHGEDSTPHR